jgi:predicted TIM-barrel fold metal-dependent hydrolase
MRFSTHCHIFNLQTVFNSGTLKILEDRLKEDYKLSAGGAEAAVGFLRGMMGVGGLVGSDTKPLPPDWGEKGPWDALMLGLRSTMDLVTDNMMGQLAELKELGPDIAVTPLMMDILTDYQAESDFPDKLFDAQVAGTQQQMLRYPGRVLPFYAVNPYRWNCYNRTITALTQGGFVGVKLYPSLGYTLDQALNPNTDAGKTMADIMKYCNDNDIPMLMHCNLGGFKQTDDTAQYCDPALWGLRSNRDGYLDTFTRLKISFGHFGGSENFVQKNDDDTFQSVIAKDSFTEHILALIGAYHGRVFADVSYHQEGVQGSPARSAYMNSLKNIMQYDGYRTQVLWGTDTWLVRMASMEKDYWESFDGRDALAPVDFDLMSVGNPRAFLGFDDQNLANNKKNIWSYVRFMESRASTMPADAKQSASWLQKAFRVPAAQRSYPS